MKRKHVGVFLVSLVVVLLIVAGATAVSGVNPLDSGHKYVRPPCAQLQDRKTVEHALASHQDLVARLESAGPGVTVDVDTPCNDQPDRALVRITYETDKEWDSIQSILGQEGFGVAVDVVSK